MALTNNRRLTPLTFGESPFSSRPVFEDYVHAIHPDTGLEVVFCPGEAKPEWLLDCEAAAAPPPPPPVAPRGNRGIKAATAG